MACASACVWEYVTCSLGGTADPAGKMKDGWRRGRGSGPHAVAAWLKLNRDEWPVVGLLAQTVRWMAGRERSDQVRRRAEAESWRKWNRGVVEGRRSARGRARGSVARDRRPRRTCGYGWHVPPVTHVPGKPESPTVPSTVSLCFAFQGRTHACAARHGGRSSRKPAGRGAW